MSRQRILSPAQEAEICKEYLANISTTKICKAYFVSRTVIKNVLVRNKIPQRKYTKSPMTDNIIDLYNAGYRVSWIAAKVGKNVRAVQSAVNVGRKEGKIE